MRKSVLRLLILLLAFCIVINGAYQVYVRLASPYKVETAYEYTVNQQFDSQGVIYKDETVIPSNEKGVVQYLYKNGERVAYQADVAKVYQSQEDVAATEQIQQIDQQISQLSDAQGKGISQEADISVLDKELKTDYYNLVESIERQQYSNLTTQKDALTALFNKRQIVTGKVSDFNESIQTLTDQKNQLAKSITSTPQTVKTPSSGYFVDTTDGLEDQLKLKNVDAVTADQLSQLIQTINQKSEKKEDTAAAGTIGKVITEPQLYYAALISSSQVADLKEGDPCTLQFSKFSKSIPATIQKIEYNKDQDKSMVVFWTNSMTEDLAAVRSDTVHVILKSFSGLRVPKQAVRVNDKGESGVFVSNGQSMNFKKIDPIYEGENYLVSQIHADDTSYLRLYDTVIVEGKDLYENKPLR